MVQIDSALTERYSLLVAHKKLSHAFNIVAVALEPIYFAQTKSSLKLIISNAEKKRLA